MRYCGVEISHRADGQHLVTLHERRGPDDLELVASFYAPGSVERVARTVQGFGRGEAVVGIGSPAGTPGRACDAQLRSLGLPAGRSVGAAGDDSLRGAGPALHDELAPLGRYVPDDPGRHHRGDVGTHPVRHGRVFETSAEAVFSVLLGHLPSPKRTPWGLQQRIATLKLKAIVDEDGGLWHRTVEELDACAAAYAAYAFTAGLGIWLGEPAEGVVVLPVSSLLDRYDPLPPPARLPLA